jgi:N-succinyl-L-ornithine transcarbamylase
MEVLVMNFTEGYNIETEDGVIMNLDTQEHIKEAAAVIGQYCDIIGCNQQDLQCCVSI